MEGKHFGSIYRPYADWVGDFALRVDNILGADPSFARYVQPLIERDLLLIHGDSLAVLAVSRSAYRHYPLRETHNWDKFFTVDETKFTNTLRIPVDGAIVIKEPSILQHLEKSFFFTQPFVVGFPGIFIAKPNSDEGARRTQSIEAAARYFLSEEQVHYRGYLEMQKPKDIFLSHKTANKVLVREVSTTLDALGYSPWLDEDRMKAGVNLERGLLQGFEDSCAAVFFVTPQFKDEGYVSTEIDYALIEKRKKGARFAIITLLIPDDDGAVGEVPKILRPYVWKSAQGVAIIREIVDALPIKPQSFVWRA